MQIFIFIYSILIIKQVMQGFLETVRQVGDTVGKVILFAEGAIDRSLQFTHGVASEGLVSSLSVCYYVKNERKNEERGEKICIYCIFFE